MHAGDCSVASQQSQACSEVGWQGESAARRIDPSQKKPEDLRTFGDIPKFIPLRLPNVRFLSYYPPLSILEQSD